MVGMLPRDHWVRETWRLDAERDRRRVVEILAAHEFPWDNVQALSFALYRTFAVPSIGRLLAETGEFTGRVQRRYDDTALLLDEILEHGLGHERGRDAVRRINRMHRSHDIGNDDMRYVLATFVVVPKRWMDRFGYRRFTLHENDSLVSYYRELGQHMGIRDLPADFAGFERLLDDYEREHFAFDPDARRVADATLDLMTTFRPFSLLPRALARRTAYAVMDEPLLRAFRYARPTLLERAAVVGGMRLRARLIARLPARRRPRRTGEFGFVRSYPDGYDIARLGTFPRCPVGPERSVSG
ncbi:MAG: oxygenase MpaB family protein [Marmoricola sp.]